MKWLIYSPASEYLIIEFYRRSKIPYYQQTTHAPQTKKAATAPSPKEKKGEESTHVNMFRKLTLLSESYALAEVPIPSPSLPNVPSSRVSETIPLPGTISILKYMENFQAPFMLNGRRMIRKQRSKNI